MNIIQEKLQSNESWYAIYTMPRTEKKVEERLSLQGIEVYLPLKISIRTWSDRKKKIKIPLIPGFVFVRTTEDCVLNMFNTSGILNVIRYNGKPARIRDYEINNLRILLGDPDSVYEEVELDVSEGEYIEVVKGPFSGIIGRCIRKQGKCRVVIEINALGKTIEINIPTSYLEKKLQS